MSKSCYLCKSKSVHQSFNKLSHEIWQCENCKLYSLKFNYNYDKFIREYYQKGYFTGNKKLRAYADYEGDKAVISMNMRNYLNRITNFVGARTAVRRDAPAQKNLKLLDCGCAMGYFMEEANRMGFDVYGIDISEYAATRAKKLFPNHVFTGPVENVGAGLVPARLKFDVITMFDLIEHLKNPILVLQKLRNLLKKDGIIVLQTGDVSSDWAKRQGQNWHFFAPPQHLHFFSRATITKMLEIAGFKVTSIKTEGKWVSLRYLFHMMRYANRDKIGDFLYKLTHKNIIGRIPVLFKFGDNMIIFAKKSTSSPA